MLDTAQEAKLWRLLNPDMTISYKTMPIGDVPPWTGRKGGGKWQKLFRQLEPDTAIGIDFTNDVEAKRARTSILSSFCHHKGRDVNFKLHTRLVRLAPNKIALYVWKEIKERKQ